MLCHWVQRGVLPQKRAGLAAAPASSCPLLGLPRGPDHRWDTGNNLA